MRCVHVIELVTSLGLDHLGLRLASITDQPPLILHPHLLKSLYYEACGLSSLDPGPRKLSPSHHRSYSNESVFIESDLDLRTISSHNATYLQRRQMLMD